MKTLLLLVASFLVATPAFAQPDFPSGTVRIYVYEDEDALADYYGSGAVISPTQVLTNYHVIKDRRKSNSVQVRFSDDSRRAATVVASSEKWDTVILKIRPTQTIPFKLGKRPWVGQNVTIAGFGSDYEYKSSRGTVSKEFLSPTGAELNDFFQIDGAVARQGDSGGPITNQNGELVGVLFGSDGNSTFGITIDRIQKIFGSRLQVSSPYDFQP